MSLEAPISFLHASREPELLYARSPSPKYLGSLASPLGPSASAPAVLGAPGHALPASNTADTIRAFDPPSPGVELASPGTDAIEDVDPQIVEALKSKDRLFVLKLGEIMETIISQHMPRMDVMPASSYQRLLVHRCAAYYKCTPETESNSKLLFLTVTSESYIPPRRLSELVPVESVVQPKFSIMRRSSRDRIKGRGSSTAGSNAGEDADLSDGEPSEAGSLHSRSSRRLTLEEREAAYQQARSRIFMDFAAKERAAGTSAGSSATASTSACSSADDCDAESVTTESEWSAPASGAPDKRLGGSQASHRSRSRKARSARASRGASPTSFAYASIYEPAAEPYGDAGYTAGGDHPAPAYPPQHMYPYGAYPQAPAGPPQPFYQPYYHGPMYYPPPPPGPEQQMTVSPPADYGQHQHHQPQHPMAPYPGQYGWPPAPAEQGPSMHPTSPPPQMAYNGTHATPPPGPYAHGPYGAYTSPPPPPPPPQAWGPYGYYPMPPPQPGPMPPPQQPGLMGPPLHSPELARQYSSSSGSSAPPSAGHSRTSSRNSSQGRRSVPPQRAPWAGAPGQDFVGPRFATGVRRSSGGSRTPGDEASSTTSSSTSSSSARTFTSTSTSSKHPLPARPDWAIGLSPNGRRPPGPVRPPPSSTDFPPLSASGAAAPPAAPRGAWGQDRAFERPPPKGNAELFNPKHGKGQKRSPEEALGEAMGGLKLGEGE